VCVCVRHRGVRTFMRYVKQSSATARRGKTAAEPRRRPDANVAAHKSAPFHAEQSPAVDRPRVKHDGLLP
jgi:hypothetical protein